MWKYCLRQYSLTNIEAFNINGIGPSNFRKRLIIEFAVENGEMQFNPKRKKIFNFEFY